MKPLKVILLITGILLTFSSCGIIDRYFQKEVTHGNISLEVPYTWLISKEENEEGYYSLEIEAPAAEMIVIIEQLGSHKNWDEIIDHYQTTYKENMPQNLRPLRFTDVEENIFHEMNACEFSYTGAHKMLIYEGRVIIFDDEYQTYTIAIMGPSGFLESDDVKHMLETLKVI